MAAIDVRPLRASDVELLVALYESSSGSDINESKRRAARLLYTAFNNPVQDREPTCFVAEKNERLVGHLGRMPVRFSVQGAYETGSFFHDFYLATDGLSEDDRKQATKELFTAAETAGKNLRLTLWSNDCDAGHELNDANHAVQTRRFVRSFKPLKQQGVLPRGLPDRFVLWMRQNLIVCGDAILSFGYKCRMTIRRCDFFDARYDELAKNLAANSSIAPHKDSAYLNWQYISRPGTDSTVYEARKSDGSLRGYVVILNPEPGRDNATIADLAANSNSASVFKCLIHFAVTHARKIRASELIALPTNPVSETALERKSFRPQEGAFPHVYASSDLAGFRRLIASIKARQINVGSFESPGL